MPQARRVLELLLSFLLCLAPWSYTPSQVFITMNPSKIIRASLPDPGPEAALERLTDLTSRSPGGNIEQRTPEGASKRLQKRSAVMPLTQSAVSSSCYLLNARTLRSREFDQHPTLVAFSIDFLAQSGTSVIPSTTEEGWVPFLKITGHHRK